MALALSSNLIVRDAVRCSPAKLLVVNERSSRGAELRHYLEEGRYQVIEATQASEGLQRILQHVPDLVLLTVSVWRQENYAFAQALRQDTRFDLLPVLLVGARNTDESRNSDYHMGADGYLAWPLDVHEMWARIDSLLAVRRRFERHLNIRERGVARVVNERPLAERIVEVIDRELSNNDFTITLLARQTGLSRSHLYRCVKELFDCSPGQMIMERRLLRAAEQLAHAGGTITEVAFVLGFKSVAHFSRCFRKRFGQSPSTYRRYNGTERQKKKIQRQA